MRAQVAQSWTDDGRPASMVICTLAGYTPMNTRSVAKPPNSCGSSVGDEGGARQLGGAAHVGRRTRRTGHPRGHDVIEDLGGDEVHRAGDPDECRQPQSHASGPAILRQDAHLRAPPTSSGQHGLHLGGGRHGLAGFVGEVRLHGDEAAAGVDDAGRAGDPTFLGAAGMRTTSKLTVAVPAPSGRWRKAATAPRESARVISAPPCMRPPMVQRSGDQSRWPTTTSLDAAVIVTPVCTA